MKTKVIAVSRGKGGQSTSTTAQALATIASKEHGLKTLLIDGDYQGNSTRTMKASVEDSTFFEVITKEMPIEETIQHVKYCDMISADEMLANADQEIRANGINLIKEVLEPIKDKYDLIIFDTQPALSPLNLSILMACDSIIIPTNATSYGLEGIANIQKTLNTVKANGNSDLKIDGILLTNYEGWTNQAKDIRNQINQAAQILETKVFEKPIRHTVKVDESQRYRTPLIDYAPRATATEDYKEFVKEFLEDSK